MLINPLGKPEKDKKIDASKIRPADRALFERMMAVNSASAVKNVADNEAEIEDLVDLHQKFKASINHEINNPLCVVRGMADMIKDDNLQEVREQIVDDSDAIALSIQSFNKIDIPAVGRDCLNSPLEKIAFRQDLVGCYLHEVIGKLAAEIANHLDDMEKALKIEQTYFSMSGTPEFDRVKNTLKTIRKQADRIRTIIAKLEELLPGDLETTSYLEELKMINLRKPE